MDTYLIRYRASIEIALHDFGTPEEQANWASWVFTHPDAYKIDQPALQAAVSMALHRRYDLLQRRMRAPGVSQSDFTELHSLAAWVAMILSMSDPIVLDRIKFDQTY